MSAPKASLIGLATTVPLEGRPVTTAVSVFRMAQPQLLESFGLSKTFAWGGVYGASTSIKDIENAYAEGIERSVTGAGGQKPGSGT